MPQSTSIAWTDSTFDPWLGCLRVSPACDHCYAAALAKRTGRRVRHGRDLWTLIREAPALEWQLLTNIRGHKT
jgi:hypothetical protein